MSKLYKEFINKDTNLQEGGKSTKYRKTVHSAAGAVVFPIWIPYRMLRALLQKCTKECLTFSINTPRRQRCLLSCKLRAYQKYKGALESAKSTCHKMRNENRCMHRLEKEIQKIEDKINNVKQDIAERF